MPEGFTPVNVGDMNFDERDGHPGQGVANGHTGMRVGTGIDKDEIGAVVACRLDAIDQGPFVVALVDSTCRPLALGQRHQRRIDVVEGGVAIHGWLSCAKQIEIRSVQNQDVSRHECLRQPKNRLFKLKDAICLLIAGKSIKYFSTVADRRQLGSCRKTGQGLIERLRLDLPEDAIDQFAVGIVDQRER